MSEVSNALEKYYSMKSIYDKKYATQKNRIIKDANLSTAEQKNRINQIKITCLKCKRKVGMVFSRNKRTLQVTCGDKTKPCALDIKIYLGIYQDLEALIRDSRTERESIKVNIIKSKLDILFQLANEDKTLKLFQEQKKIYTDIESRLLRLKRQMDPQFERHLRGEQAKALVYEFHEAIASFRNVLKQYVNEDQQSLLQEAIRMYMERLIPLQEAIRKAKYKLVEVEEVEQEQGKYFRLIEEDTTVRDTEFVAKPAKVLIFKI